MQGMMPALSVASRRDRETSVSMVASMSRRTSIRKNSQLPFRKAKEATKSRQYARSLTRMVAQALHPLEAVSLSALTNPLHEHLIPADTILEFPLFLLIIVLCENLYCAFILILFQSQFWLFSHFLKFYFLYIFLTTKFLL